MTDRRRGTQGGRLFERLTATEQPDAQGDESPLVETVESIKRHLVELLNSHPGHSECAPGLGLLDFNDATLGVLDLKLNIQRAIRLCIERYEPRVSHVEVKPLPHDGDPLQLRFQIHATLDTGKENAQTTIDLLLNDKRYQCLN